MNENNACSEKGARVHVLFVEFSGNDLVQLAGGFVWRSTSSWALDEFSFTGCGSGDDV